MEWIVLRRVLPASRPVGSTEPFGPNGAIQLLPDGTAMWMLPLLTLVVYLGVNWWASWYPGAEPGGGGYIAQRIFSAKNEKHGLLATLWFNIAHYALRPWPWIIVALCSLVLYNGTTPNPETGQPDAAFGYVQVMNDYLPDRLSRSAAGIICGGLHEHHLNADELGRKLYYQRLLSSLC